MDALSPIELELVLRHRTEQLRAAEAVEADAHAALVAAEAAQEAARQTLAAAQAVTDAAREAVAALAPAPQPHVDALLAALAEPAGGAAAAETIPQNGQRYQILVSGEALAVKKKGNFVGLGCADLAADALVFECHHVTEGKHAGYMEFVVAEGSYAGKRLDKWYRDNPKGKDMVKIYRKINIMPQNPAQRWKIVQMEDSSLRLAPFCEPNKFLGMGENGLARGTAAGAPIAFLPV
jgi:hypothetical protein